MLSQTLISHDARFGASFMFRNAIYTLGECKWCGGHFVGLFGRNKLIVYFNNVKRSVD
jgi:hypothetical protein